MPDDAKPDAPVAPPPKGRRRDRLVKLAFLAAVAVIAAIIWWHQRQGPDWPGWREDLDAATAQARSENRKLLVLFTASPPGHWAREFQTKTLAKKQNQQAVADAGLILVHLTMDPRLDSPQARRYGIRTLPTLLLLSPQGKELNRREGEAIVPEAAFREGFLDSEDVKPTGS